MKKLLNAENKIKNTLILKIVVVLFHEIFGHGKIRAGNIQNLSPYQFKQNGILKQNNVNEAGQIIERLLLDNLYFRFLKTFNDNENFSEKVLSSNLWVENDMSSLNELFSNNPSLNIFEKDKNNNIKTKRSLSSGIVKRDEETKNKTIEKSFDNNEYKDNEQRKEEEKNENDQYVSNFNDDVHRCL